MVHSVVRHAIGHHGAGFDDQLMDPFELVKDQEYRCHAIADDEVFGMKEAGGGLGIEGGRVHVEHGLVVLGGEKNFESQCVFPSKGKGENVRLIWGDLVHVTNVDAVNLRHSNKDWRMGSDHLMLA